MTRIVVTSHAIKWKSRTVADVGRCQEDDHLTLFTSLALRRYFP